MDARGRIALVAASVGLFSSLAILAAPLPAAAAADEVVLIETQVNCPINDQWPNDTVAYRWSFSDTDLSSDGFRLISASVGPAVPIYGVPQSAQYSYHLLGVEATYPPGVSGPQTLALTVVMPDPTDPQSSVTKVASFQFAPGLQCVRRPKVSFTSYCFGELAVHMENGADANTMEPFDLLQPDGSMMETPLEPGMARDYAIPPPWANQVVIQLGTRTQSRFTGGWQLAGCYDPPPGTPLPPYPWAQPGHSGRPGDLSTVPAKPRPADPPKSTEDTTGHIGPSEVPPSGESSAASANPPAQVPTADGSSGPGEPTAEAGGRADSGLALLTTGATATGLAGAGAAAAFVIFLRRRRSRLADLAAPPQQRWPRDVTPD